MPALVVDALDGSKIDAGYLGQIRSKPHATVLHVTVNNLTRIVPNPDLRRAFVDLADYGKLVAGHSALCKVMASRADWQAIGATGRVGLILGYQNSGFIGQDLSLLSLLHQAGVRVLQITHNGLNDYGGGCAVPDPEAGITPLGRDFVKAANDAGILIDCSHTSDRLTLDVCEVSGQPVLITHANSSAVNPHRRNRSDAAMKAVSATGGVIGVTFLPSLALNNDQISSDGMIGHIQHVLDVVGADAIGFGSDFTTNQDKHGERYSALSGDGINVMQDELPYPVDGNAGLGAFFADMRAHGFSEELIAGFAGGNFARVFEQNER